MPPERRDLSLSSNIPQPRVGHAWDSHKPICQTILVELKCFEMTSIVRHVGTLVLIVDVPFWVAFIFCTLWRGEKK